MNVQEDINAYISSLPEAKRSDMQELYMQLITESCFDM